MIKKKPKITWKSKLRDRGFVDQSGFVLFCVAGSCFILGFKHLGLDPRWVTAISLTIMLLYAILVGKSGSGGLRSDQAGDNCYYLGLIFTLTSLSYAISTFDPENTASSVVQGFGVAMSSTVAGLVLRVFFNQGRPDLENVEDLARMELTEAVNRLKTELSSATLTISDFSRQILQSLGEVRDSAKKAIENASKESADGLESVFQASLSSLSSLVDDARSGLTSSAKEFSDNSRKISRSIDGLVKKMADHEISLASLVDSQKNLDGSLKIVEECAKRALSVVESLAQQTSEVSKTTASAMSGAAELQGMLKVMQSSIAITNASLKTVQEETKRHLEEIGRVPVERVTEAADGLVVACERLQAHISGIASAHESATNSLAGQSLDMLAVTRTHNEGLKVELERSVGAVSRVHASLEEMTASLARHAEAIANHGTD